MFRRIQFIDNQEGPQVKGENKNRIHGIMWVSDESVVNSWINDLRGPYGRRSKGIPNNARFYFTEEGWKEVGKKIIKACHNAGQKYKLIVVKENSVNVVWRDEHTGYEVAVQQKKKIK